MRFSMSRFHRLNILAVIMLAATGLGAQSLNTDSEGLAAGGYDLVAYIVDAQAVAGEASIRAEYNGAIYLFSSDMNRRQFLEDPEAYLPAYGGYCAWAVGQGYLADIDPEAWTVHEGRLYLNYSSGVRRRFLRGIDDQIAAADENWPGLR